MKRYLVCILLFILVVFICYKIYDSNRIPKDKEVFKVVNNDNKTDDWFVKNEISVVFKESVEFDEIKRFVYGKHFHINGNEQNVINTYTIILNKDFKDYDELESYCSNLVKNNSIVELCSASLVMRESDEIK